MYLVHHVHNHLDFAFHAGYVSPHHCRLPANVSVDAAIPRDKHGELEKCLMYENFTQNSSTTHCTDGWTYERVYGEKTIIMEVRSINSFHGG